MREEHADPAWRYGIKLPGAIHPVSPHGAGLGIIANMGRSVAICSILAAAVLLLPITFAAAETSFKEMLTDPADGAFDRSRFIKTRTGFVPIVAPVTEPAVGYGIAGGVVFFHRKEGEPPREAATAGEGRMAPPSLTAVGGFGTENGSRGVFGGHRGVWKEDRIR